MRQLNCPIHCPFPESSRSYRCPDITIHADSAVVQSGTGCPTDKYATSVALLGARVGSLIRPDAGPRIQEMQFMGLRGMLGVEINVAAVGDAKASISRKVSCPLHREISLTYPDKFELVIENRTQSAQGHVYACPASQLVLTLARLLGYIQIVLKLPRPPCQSTISRLFVYPRAHFSFLFVVSD